jgi:hypothetical protein
MKEDGRDFTSPTLDLKDFIGLKFTTGAMENFTSYLISNLPISTGSVPTGLPAKTYNSVSVKNTGTP